MTKSSINELPMEKSTQLDDMVSVINMHIQNGNNGAYVIGMLYNDIVDRRLALIAGYKDTRDFFNKNVKALSQATLSVYGRVAKLYSEQVCTQFGPFKLNALAAYAEATGRSAPQDPVGFLIDVPMDDGRSVSKPFEECSTDEITRASKAKRAQPKFPVPVADQARLLFLRDSVETSFSEIAPVRMTSRNTGGKTLISLLDVPLTELQRLMQALQDGLDTKPTLAARAMQKAA